MLSVGIFLANWIFFAACKWKFSFSIFISLTRHCVFIISNLIPYCCKWVELYGGSKKGGNFEDFLFSFSNWRNFGIWKIRQCRLTHLSTHNKYSKTQLRLQVELSFKWGLEFQLFFFLLPSRARPTEFSFRARCRRRLIHSFHSIFPFAFSLLIINDYDYLVRLIQKRSCWDIWEMKYVRITVNERREMGEAKVVELSEDAKSSASVDEMWVRGEAKWANNSRHSTNPH